MIEWTDRKILELDRPPNELVDLSLMAGSPPFDVRSRLDEISRAVPSLELLPEILSTGVQRLRAEPALGPTVARGLFAI